MGAPDFSKLKTLIHELIFVQNVFYPETMQNGNEAVPMGKKIVQRERNQQLHQLKNYNIG